MKFFFSQSISNEKDSHEDLEQPTTSIEPEIVSRKPQVTISSNTAIIKENTSEEIRSNRKSMYEPIITRRTSPMKPTTTHAIERVSSIIPMSLNSHCLFCLFPGFYSSIKSWQSKSHK